MSMKYKREVYRELNRLMSMESICRLMNENNISTEELSKGTGISPNRIKKCMKTESTITIEELSDILLFFGKYCTFKEKDIKES